MYLHIGNNVIIHDDDIIGIFDIDHATMSKATVEFLEKAEKEGRLVNIGAENDMPKAFVATAARDGKTMAYITPISSQTLAKRGGDNMRG